MGKCTIDKDAKMDCIMFIWPSYFIVIRVRIKHLATLDKNNKIHIKKIIIWKRCQNLQQMVGSHVFKMSQCPSSWREISHSMSCTVVFHLRWRLKT